MWLAISVLFNFVVIGFTFATGIGQGLLRRFRNKMLYRRGNHVNVLFVSKSGTVNEKFIKKDKDGEYKLNDNAYICNPSLLFQYQGIPTYLVREGTPDPLNPWLSEFAGEMSCGEMDTVMQAKGSFDVKMWLEQNKMLFFISLLIMIGACVAAVYFGFNAYQMLRDGSYAAVQCITPPTVINPVL
jgi:hypothetical protein